MPELSRFESHVGIRMNSKSPIYLVSVPRSGATLLAAMLNSHPNIAMFNEPWFFHMLPKYGTLKRRLNREMLGNDLCEAAKRFGARLNGTFKEEFLEKLSRLERPKPLEAFGLFMDLYARYVGKRRWGVKQPLGIFDVSKLSGYFPDLKVIHIIRDPRATVAQRMGKKSDKNESLVDSVRYATSWSDTVRYGKELSKKCPSGYFEVRYEDLVMEPVVSLKRICAFLDEDYEAKMLSYYHSTNPYVPRDDAGYPHETHRDVVLPVHREDVVCWKRVLTRREVAAVEAICEGGIVGCGYDLSKPQRRREGYLLWPTWVILKWRLLKLYTKSKIIEGVFHSCRKAFIFLFRK